MDTLVEIPVLDVFKGSEAFWTEKFTGRGANISRGVSRWYETMDSGSKEARRCKHSEDMVKYHSNISPEEREYNGNRISKGHGRRSVEAKLETSKKISESLTRFNYSFEGRPSGFYFGVRSRRSVSRSPEEYEAYCKAVSKGLRNMSEEAKLQRDENIAKGVRNYYLNISVGERQRLRDEGLARWLRHSEEWLLEHGRLTSEAMANMVSTQVEERGKSISEAQIAYWSGLTPEERAYKNEINSQAQIRRWLEASPKQIEYWLSCIDTGGCSLPEALLGLYLEREFTGGWLHNGQKQQGVVVGRRVPDFISTEGKYIIELFGDYWHPTEEEVSRVKEYRTFGWDCLVVWEYEVWLGLDLGTRLRSISNV